MKRNFSYNIHSKKRLNVLFILADDMGYGDFSIFNKGLSQTPVLDQLTKEGICFTQHYSASPVCAPARASLLTGRYPQRTGAIDTLEGRGLDRLSLKEVTLADILKSAGYATGIIGKWHLGALDPRYHPNARGLDEFVGFRGGWQDYYKWRLDYNGEFRKADGRYLTDVFTEEAIRFLKRHKNEPFFLHLAYNAPHFPLQAPEEEVRPFREKGKFTKGVNLIYGMIKRMDKKVGSILEKLRSLGLEKNTIVLFTSDNGPQFGGKGEMRITRFNYNFRGCKGNVWEGGIRVPMVIRWPDGFERGKVINEMIHFVDWLPTILAIAGIEIPKNIKLDGQNIFPFLQGREKSQMRQLFWQWNRYTPIITSNAAMRDGNWKLVRPPILETLSVAPSDLRMDKALKYEPEKFTDICRDPEPMRKIPSPASPQLFSLKDDPFEKYNLFFKYPERVRKMSKGLEKWFEEVEGERRRIEE